MDRLAIALSPPETRALAPSAGHTVAATPTPEPLGVATDWSTTAPCSVGRRAGTPPRESRTPGFRVVDLRDGPSPAPARCHRHTLGESAPWASKKPAPESP